MGCCGGRDAIPECSCVLEQEGGWEALVLGMFVFKSISKNYSTQPGFDLGDLGTLGAG